MQMVYVYSKLLVMTGRNGKRGESGKMQTERHESEAVLYGIGTRINCMGEDGKRLDG